MKGEPMMSQVEQIFAAYMDEYHKITLIVPNSYYGGEVGPFVLQEQATNTITELRIEEKHFLGDNIKYVLSVLGFIEVGNVYDVIDCYQNRSRLSLGYLARTEEFDKRFYYKEEDLGCTFTPEKTTFKVWAPTATDVELSLRVKETCCLYKMKRQSRGVWAITIEQNLEGCPYRYLVTNNFTKKEAIDPYGVASTANGEFSVVVDLAKTVPMTHPQPILKQATDAIIYEVSVCDFTIDPSANIKNKGKYLGVIETGELPSSSLKSGLGYLKDLGITHVQLLPIFDFEGVNEHQPKQMYNWGYNPAQYNVPEGSYSSNPDDPYARINELKTMIDTLHEHEFGVIMDVVYNHVYSRETHPFDALVPTYYYRYDYQGMPADATGCGNDLATERAMVRKYIVDSIRYWLTEYKIDGFRFDLMGILDVDTMNEVRRVCDEINPNIILYGEGWDMPTPLPQQQKAAKFNAKLMPHIGHFNDKFRDTIKGHTFNHKDRGFALGNFDYADKAKLLLSGSSGLNEGESYLFYHPTQSINYVECHDNHTLYDRMLLSNADEDESVRQKRQLLATAMVIFAQGIPFIHCGQEFFRTKQGVENSYNQPNEINAIKWDEVMKHEQAIQLVSGYIKIRKAHGALRFATSNLVKKHLRIFHHHHSVIEYNLRNVKAYGDYSEIRIYFNTQNQCFDIPVMAKGFYQIADEIKADLNLDQVVGTSLTLTPLSTTIIVKL